MDRRGPVGLLLLTTARFARRKIVAPQRFRSLAVTQKVCKPACPRREKRGALEMRQALEITRPDSCINRAARDEMVFVLIGRDKVAPWAIYFWCVMRCVVRKNRWKDGQIQEALSAARAMREDRRS